MTSKHATAALAAIALALAAGLAAAQVPLPKSGACPSGYHTSGDYCLASSANAKPIYSETAWEMSNR